MNATVLQPLFDIVFSNFKLQLSYFNIFAWQLLFVSSSLLGFMLQNKILHWRHPVLTVLRGDHRCRHFCGSPWRIC
ncbi:OpgC domain-containing protein [Photobacterium kishitanii]|uniref:OpgC domain-containing protein n=1 Tax=Photobacterium kishitanii TaxID=318456 RepID=UPI0034E9333C